MNGAATGRRDHERGSIAPAIPIIAMMLFLLVGLVVDSARQLDARSRAIAYAQEAARAGAERIILNEEDAKIDTQAASLAVQRFCDTAMAADSSLKKCEVGVGDDQVTVHTEVEIQATVLSAVGLHTLTASGTGRATAEQGVTGPGKYPDGIPSPTVSVSMVPLPIPIGTPEPPGTDPGTTPPSPPDTTTPPAGG